MAINTQVYGDVNDWDVYRAGGNTDPDLCVYCTPDYLSDRSTTPIGSPIDKTLACSGLGTESCFSHLKFYETTMLAETGAQAWHHDPIQVQPSIIENREVTSWCFSDTRSNYSASDWNSRFSIIPDSNESGTLFNTHTIPEQCKWAPMPAYVGNYQVGSGNASDIKPITQFNHSNLVAIIYVRFKNQKTSAQGSWSFTTLKNYIDNYSTNYPYIYGVYIRLYVKSELSSSLTALNSINNCNISILDKIQLPISNPNMYSLVCGAGAEIKIMGSICWNASFDFQGTTSRDSKTYIGACIPDTWEVACVGGRTTDPTYPYTAWGYICRTYDNTFRDEVFEQVACLGILFSDTDSIVSSFSITSDNVYCGILDENLIGHGQWTQGSHNTDNAQLNWDNSNDSTYVPPADPTPSTDEPYDAATEYITASGGINVGGRWYCDDYDHLNSWLALINWCNGIDLETVSIQENFYGQNPIDCILEGKIIFVSDYTFGKTIQGSVRQPIRVGSYDSGGIGAWVFTHAYPETFDCGDVTIEKIYGDFRDLEPYTTYTVLLPFASSVEIPSDIVVGHTVGLTETIDPQSGDLKYRILVDGCEYATSTGNCAIDLSINGLEIATYRQDKFRLQTQQQTSEFNAVASLVGGASGALIASNYGNIAGAISQVFGGLVNASNSYNQSRAFKETAERLKPSPAKIQNSSPNVEWGRSPFPCIVASSPRMLSGFETSLEPYRQRVGFATYTVGKIKDQKYVVVCENVVLSGFSCTKEEMVMIKQLLESGIYIK